MGVNQAQNLLEVLMSVISVEAKGQKSNYGELNRSAERSGMKEGSED